MPLSELNEGLQSISDFVWSGATAQWVVGICGIFFMIAIRRFAR